MCGECAKHGVEGRRAGASRAGKVEELERRQRAAIERSDKGGAANVGDLAEREVEQLELR